MMPFWTSRQTPELSGVFPPRTTEGSIVPTLSATIPQRLENTLPSKHPWNAIPATRSSAPKLQIRFYTVLGIVGLAALAGPLSLAVSAAQGSAPTAVVAQADYETTGFAQLVAEDFLSARTTLLPVAEGVDPTFGQTEGRETGQPQPLPYSGLSLYNTQGPKTEGNAEAGTLQTFDVTSFLFRMGEKPMKVEVTTLRTEDGPVLAAQPALLPVDATLAEDVAPMNYQENAALSEFTSEALTTSVEEWAEAYAAGDSARLYAITGERRTGQVYQGLGGFTVEEVSITSAVTDSAESVSAKLPEGADTPIINPLYLRVKVLLIADGADRYSASNEFDLLINDSESGSPRVIAWGGPGSAPFAPFSNSNRTS